MKTIKINGWSLLSKGSEELFAQKINLATMRIIFLASFSIRLEMLLGWRMQVEGEGSGGGEILVWNDWRQYFLLQKRSEKSIGRQQHRLILSLDADRKT